MHKKQLEITVSETGHSTIFVGIDGHRLCGTTKFNADEAKKILFNLLPNGVYKMHFSEMIAYK